MNTEHTPLLLDGSGADSFDHLDNWQTVALVTLGVTGLALVLTGAGALVIAVGHLLRRLVG